jgi:uncharacterized phage protein gp47/JayE
MAFTTQTIQQIGDTIVAQMSSTFGQTIPIFEKAFVRVLSKVLAGQYALLWRYAGWMFLQLFVRYASDNEVTVGTRTIRPLREWGRWIGVGDPDPGERAQLVVTVTVTNQTGALNAGELLLRASTGVGYAVSYAVELDAPTVNVTIRAVSDQDGGGGVGAIGNLVAGDVVSFMNPLPNISRDATVVSVALSGADAQTTESYRSEVLEAFQNRPQGGALTDYRLWGKSVSGIVQIYPYKSVDPGEMDIYVEATEESSGSPDGVPTEGQLTAVEEAIIYDDDGLASRRPAGVENLNMYGITRKGYDVEITGLNPDTPETQDGIIVAMTEYFLSRDPFILGLSMLPRRSRISAAELSGIASSVAASHGATFSQLTLCEHDTSSPLTIVELGHGEKAKLSDCFFPS